MAFPNVNNLTSNTNVVGHVAEMRDFSAKDFGSNVTVIRTFESNVRMNKINGY